MIAFGDGCFINLGTVLIGSKTQLESSRVEILINTSAVKPTFPGMTADIQVDLLLTEMICIIIQFTPEFLRPKLRMRVYRISNSTGCDSRFRNLQ